MSNNARELRIVISEDGSQAWLHVQAGLLPACEDVLVLVEDAGITVNDEIRKRAAEVVALLAEGGTAEGGVRAARREFLIAEGRPPVEAEDGALVWSAELAKVLQRPGEDERIDYFARTEMITVVAGSLLGQLAPPKDGQPGLTLYGQERKPQRLRGTPLTLGPGVRVAEDGSGCVVAEVAGRVLVEQGQVQIREVLDIPGDVDLRSGSVNACVDVYVRGTVRANFKVRTTQSLHVERVVEAAEVDAGKDVTVRGGVFGQDGAGCIRAGGRVTAKLFNETNVQAGDDICFQREILNSRVYTVGRLIGRHGTVIGGDTYARESVQVRVLGSEASIATWVATGIHVDTLRRVQRLERRIKDLDKSAEQIRQAVEPLMANMKRLLAAQRERATELLSKADELDGQVEQFQQECARLRREGAPLGVPHVLVGETVYAGVRVTLGSRAVRIRHELHGPLRIEMRKVEDVTEVVAVNLRTGSVTVLPSTELDLDTPLTSATEPSGTKDGTSHAHADNRKA